MDDPSLSNTGEDNKGWIIQSPKWGRGGGGLPRWKIMIILRYIMTVKRFKHNLLSKLWLFRPLKTPCIWILWIKILIFYKQRKTNPVFMRESIGDPIISRFSSRKFLFSFLQVGVTKKNDSKIGIFWRNYRHQINNTTNHKVETRFLLSITFLTRQLTPFQYHELSIFTTIVTPSPTQFTEITSTSFVGKIQNGNVKNQKLNYTKINEGLEARDRNRKFYAPPDQNPLRHHQEDQYVLIIQKLSFISCYLHLFFSYLKISSKKNINNSLNQFYSSSTPCSISLIIKLILLTLLPSL